MTESSSNIDRTLREIAKFQFVLSEGRKGNHLLFDQEKIRGTFVKEPAELAQLFQNKLDEINAALNQTFQFETFEEKRTFINSLPEDIQQAMIFGYFQLLDGTDSESQTRSVH
jgi:hypothetical protein